MWTRLDADVSELHFGKIFMEGWKRIENKQLTCYQRTSVNVDGQVEALTISKISEKYESIESVDKKMLKDILKFSKVNSRYLAFFR